MGEGGSPPAATLSQEVLIPRDEVGVAGDRARSGESEMQVLVSEMVQIEVGRRRVLEVGEPAVEKAPKVVGVRERRSSSVSWFARMC